MSDSETHKEPVEKKKVLTEKQLANLQRMREQKAIKRKAEEMIKERERATDTPAPAPAPAPVPAPGPAPSHASAVDPEVRELKEYLKAYMNYKDEKKRRKAEAGANSGDMYAYGYGSRHVPAFNIMRR